MSDPFRIYAPEECGPDGYPLVWHRLPADHPALDAADLVLPGGMKDVARALAAHRCERCHHPFRVHAGGREWSRCDALCTHDGPVRCGAYGELVMQTGQFRAHRARCNAEHDARWRILTVHHLNGVKADLRWWNLAALCQRCHLRVQGRVQMERVWPWEHSDWFKLHAAGWYAFAYLDEDISREEAVERMGELLALERAA